MISRAQMGSQLKGNRMATRPKKSTKKKALGGLLTGDAKGIAPFLGVIPQMIYRNQKAKRADATDDPNPAAGGTRKMRRGKAVSKRQAGGQLAGMDPMQQAAAPMAGKEAMRQAVEQAAAAVTSRRPSKTPAPLMRQTQKMNSGGRPGRRGDGICQRGRTKGRMV